MNRLPLTILLPAMLGGALLGIDAARSGEKEPQTLSALRRVELSSPESSGIYSLSENGAAVGSVGGHPARWTGGTLSWWDPTLVGAATQVSDDGACLAGQTWEGTGIFRKIGDNPLEELPLLDIGAPPDVWAYPVGIRNDGSTWGTCAGYVDDEYENHAVFWTTDGQIHRLLPDSVSSSLFGVNEAGTVLGAHQETQDSPWISFILENGQMRDPAPGIVGQMTPTAISPSGVVAGAGYKDSQGLIWFLNRGGVVSETPIGSNISRLDPWGVNDAGLMVGRWYRKGAVAALNGRLFFLEPLLAPGDSAKITSAVDVSAAGEIAVNATVETAPGSVRHSASVLVPIESDVDLVGTVENLKAKRISGGNWPDYRVQGILRVRNTGKARARSTSIQVTLFPVGHRDRLELQERILPLKALAPGESRQIRLNAILPGEYPPYLRLRVTLDPAGLVAETDELNNFIEAPISPRR